MSLDICMIDRIKRNVIEATPSLDECFRRKTKHVPKAK